MTIAVTAASGNLGRLVIAELLAAGVRPGGIVAIARTPRKVDDLAAQGIEVRQANYDDIAGMQAALQGATTVLVISGTEMGRRVEQHANVIDAANLAGAQLVAYTSVLRARESTISPLTGEHAETENYLEQTDAPWVIVRNGFYSENYLMQAKQAARSGTLVTSAGKGLTASAARKDFAAGIAAVLTGDAHAGKRYEFSGDTAWTMDELGQTIAEITGKPVAVQHVDHAVHRETLVGAGVKDPWATMQVGIDQAVAAGEYGAITHELSRLTGRPTTPLRETLAAALT